jgi:hypothetical protein
MINGSGPYYYEVKSVREGKTVRQVHIRYIGTSPGGGASSSSERVVPKPQPPETPSAPGPRYATSPETGKKVKVPEILYHGTSIRNLPRVASEGLQVGMRPTSVTEEFEHVDDTMGNVSLARKEKDAVFFSLASAGIGGDQAILRIDTSKIPAGSHIFVRDLFDNPKGEFKVFGNIPPEAIKEVMLRKFSQTRPLTVTEEVVSLSDFKKGETTKDKML